MRKVKKKNILNSLQYNFSMLCSHYNLFSFKIIQSLKFFWIDYLILIVFDYTNFNKLQTQFLNEIKISKNKIKNHLWSRLWDVFCLYRFIHIDIGYNLTWLFFMVRDFTGSSWATHIILSLYISLFIEKFLFLLDLKFVYIVFKYIL